MKLDKDLVPNHAIPVLFHHLDHDGSGSVDAKELARFMANPPSHDSCFASVAQPPPDPLELLIMHRHGKAFVRGKWVGDLPGYNNFRNE